MKILNTVLVFICLIFIPGVGGAVSLKGTVVNVQDGDTLTIETAGGEFFKVRLQEIDAPELSQAFGRQARRFTYDRAFKKVVTVEYETVDLYRRLIGVVLLPDGQVLNEELVRQGLAWHYRVHYPSQEHLRELEYRAWKSKIGLWVDPEAIPPWQFRRDGLSDDPPENPALADYDRIFSYGLIGNPETRVYLWPACRNYPGKGKEFVLFGSRLEAEEAGFSASPDCVEK